jgi:hypothetical protein
MNSMIFGRLVEARTGLLRGWEECYGFNLDQIIGLSEAADEQQRVA